MIRGFKNTVSHEPKLIKLLPIEIEAPKETEERQIPMNYEPEEEEVLDVIIPKYVCSLIYGGLIEAVASENGARMQAMEPLEIRLRFLENLPFWQSVCRLCWLFWRRFRDFYSEGMVKEKENLQRRL